MSAPASSLPYHLRTRYQVRRTHRLAGRESSLRQRGNPSGHRHASRLLAAQADLHRLPTAADRNRKARPRHRQAHSRRKNKGIMRTVRLITCEDSFQAQLIKGALENEGIPSVLHNVNTSNVMRGLIPAIAGVDIFVYERDYDQALQLLEENQMIPEQLKYCPRCHSGNIRFELKKRRRLRALLATSASLIAGIPPGTEHWEYICNDCGARFDKPVGRKSSEEKTD